LKWVIRRTIEGKYGARAKASCDCVNDLSRPIIQRMDLCGTSVGLLEMLPHGITDVTRQYDRSGIRPIGHRGHLILGPGMETAA
jgi:hypothetical protein